MKRIIAKYGSRAIDGRSKLAYSIKAWRKDLIADLGGDVSTQQLAIIECASLTRMMISSVDAWIVAQPSLLTRDRVLMPVILQRQQLVNSLVSMMTQLGLQRRSKQVTLQDLIEQGDDNDSGHENGEAKAQN
jgi:hypothetical protein